MIPSLICCLPQADRLVAYDRSIFERHQVEIKRFAGIRLPEHADGHATRENNTGLLGDLIGWERLIIFILTLPLIYGKYDFFSKDCLLIEF